VVPESGVFNVPFLIRDYDHAYKLLNGDVGKQLSELILNKYKLQVIFYYDYGFRHFWNTKRPITKPEDLKGLKMRVMQSKIMTDTVNALGASAVPMAWGDVIPAVQQGVIDGADLPIVNIDSSKVYDVAKYTSMTFHNYGPTMVTMNPDVWKGLTPAQQKLITTVGMQAQKRVIDETASVDSAEGAKRLLESKGMAVNAPDLAAFRKIAEEKVWPQYKKEYADLWDKIVATK
jgi:tripartite ATP-independent transporter DctP family solute receptor